ncbi:MAG: hypothetical protein V3W20_15020 [Candidatus Neomarinimicrobiota bacterium]
MRKFAVIFIFSWLGLRILLHSFVLSDVGVIYSVYFNGQNIIIFGLFCIVYDFIKTKRYRLPYMTANGSEKLIIVSIIYSAWCLVVDNLIMSGIGAHDSAGYAITSMLIISIGALWAKFI